MKKIVLFFCLVVLTLVLVACPASGGNGTPGSEPTISSFTADPQVLPFGGGTTTLSWTVSGADTLEIDPGIGAVSGTSQQVQVAETTTFTLTAGNDNGSVEEVVQVTVEDEVVDQAPVINSFTVEPDTLPAGGGDVTFTWDVEGASVIEIDNGVGVVETAGISPAGSVTVNVTASADYTLTASNSAGATTQTVSVTVEATNSGPEIISFTASPNNLPVAGGTVTLAWQVTNADTISIDQNVGDVTGLSSQDVQVASTTTFTLTATNSVASETAELTVTVAQAGSKQLGTVSIVETTASVAGQVQTLVISVGSFNEFLGASADLPAEPWSFLYDQCFTTNDAPDDNTPVEEDDIGVSLDAGEGLDIKFSGTTVTTLEKRVDEEGDIVYLQPFGDFITTPLPDTVTVDIPGAEYASFSGAVFPSVTAISNFSPTSGADLNAAFTWTAGDAGNGILISLISDPSANLGISCFTRDDGSFNVPAETIAQVGNFQVQFTQVARFAARQETKGDAVLYLTTTKAQGFGDIALP